nr:MAG TPA: hypothetical protein [Ackermannviridae sp.]
MSGVTVFCVREGVTVFACAFAPSVPDIVPVTPRTVTPCLMFEAISFFCSVAEIATFPEPS